MQKLRLFLFGAALVALGPVAGQPSDRLTLSRAESLALENDEQLKLQAARIDARSELTEVADELPDPKLRLFALNYPTDTFDADQEPMTQNVVGIRQDFPAGKSRRIRGLKAEAGVREATAQYAQSRATLLSEVRGLWVDIFELEGRLRLVAERRDLYQESLAAALGGYRVGRSTQEQVVSVKVRLATLEDREYELQGRIDARRDELWLWLGDESRLPLPGELPDRLTRVPEGLSDQHPELVALEARTEQARQEIDLAREAYKPDWALELNYGYRVDRVDLVTLGVTMDLPVFRNKRQDRRLAASRHELAAASHALSDRRLSLEAEAKALRSRVQSRGRRIEVYRESILPQLRDVTRLTTSDYEQGRVGFSALLEAREAQIDARESLLALRTGLARDIIELRYLAEEMEP